MQPSMKRSAASEDEEDLESLRLAALQSLKRQAQPLINGLASLQVSPKVCNPKPFGLKGSHKRNRGFHGGGRSGRNGAYNNRIRSSNLISVQTIEPGEPNDSSVDTNRNKKFTDKSIPKLILPQDRYCNTKATENKTSEASSKFDRYNDSDDSDSDSESENERISGAESPRKLERASSLEAIMQELENQIQGDPESSAEPAPKLRRIKKSRKSKPEIVESEMALLESSEELCASESEIKNKVEIKKVEGIGVKENAVQCNKKDQVDTTVTKNEIQELPARRKSNSSIRPPVLSKSRRPQSENCIPQNLLINPSIHNLPYINPSVPVATPVIPFPPTPYTNFNVSLGHTVPFDAPLPYTFPAVSSLGAPNDIHSPPRHIVSNRYERPMSPLSIKTDILNTISAPLSPRSAAFVLQNREIIERRKKSPRRSYSRSPSPEFLRRSLSPRYRRSNSRPSRSPSPVRQRHSPSRRVSPVRRTSPVGSGRRLSPNVRRISPNDQPSSRRSSPNNRYRLSSPKRPSPSGRVSPKRPRRSPQRSSIRNRVGNQPASIQPNKPEGTVLDNEKERKTRKRSRSISLSLSPSPERYSHNSPFICKDEDECSQVDLVLEARKKKFETNGTVPTEGIIRLKPKVNTEEIVETRNSDEVDEEQKIELQPEVEEDELNEEELLGGDDTYIDFNLKVDDLFSDEESDNENEGRFKSNRQPTPRDVIVMPFTQLLNGPNKAKNEPVAKDKRSYDRERDRKDRSRSDRRDRDKNQSTRSRNTPERSRFKEERVRERTRSKQRSRSPVRIQSFDGVNNAGGRSEAASKSSNTLKNSSENIKKESGASEKRSLKGSSTSKDRKKPPIVSLIENKKIEIKIRNPSKYEIESRNYDVANKDEPVREKKANSRKVEVANDHFPNQTGNGDFDELEPEIIIENEDSEEDDVINKNEDTGDLRAQLSRKRAERQNKLPKAEGVPSRLLQNALQGAVFKKSKKSKSKKKDKEAAPLDEVDASVCTAVKGTTAKTGYGVAEINFCTANKDRKVRVLHCDAEPLATASDGKLPIHLRLGIPGSVEIFTDSKAHKISRKRSKNRGSFDKV